MSVVDGVRDLVAPLLAERHLELYDVEMAGGVLRVSVLGAGELDLDALADLTRAISRGLDEADPISSRYTLEVSSPGLERTLRTPQHFEGAVGELVKIKTAPGVDDDRRVTGVLDAADASGIAVRTDEGGPGGPTVRRLAYDDIVRARTVFEWGPGVGTAPTGPRSERRRAGAGTSDEKRERNA